MRPDRQRALWGVPAAGAGPISQDIALAAADANPDAEAFHVVIPKHGIFAAGHHQCVNRPLRDPADALAALILHRPSPAAGHHLGTTETAISCQRRKQYAI